MKTYRAVLSPANGSWRMFVAVPGHVSLWPTWEFADAIPTPEARAAALRNWGYEIPDGTVWDWHEDTEPDGSVVVIAGVIVRHITATPRPTA